MTTCATAATMPTQRMMDAVLVAAARKVVSAGPGALSFGPMRR